MNIVTEKKCSACGEVKPIDQFSNEKRSKDTHMSICKVCASANAAKWNRENRERRKENERKSYAANRDKFLSKNRKWKKDNPQKILVINRNWHRKNPSRSKELRERWEKKNPEAKRIRDRNRRARLLKSEGKFTVKEWKDLCQKYGNICLCCRKPNKLTADHVIPISKGGKNTIENIQPLCGSCNSSKHTSIIDYRPSHQK